MNGNGIPGGGVELGGPKSGELARVTVLFAGLIDFRHGPAPGIDAPAHVMLLDVAAGTAYALPIDLAGARRLHAGLGRLVKHLQASSTETPAPGGREDKHT